MRALAKAMRIYQKSRPAFTARKFSELSAGDRRSVESVERLCRLPANSHRLRKLKESLLPRKLWPFLEERLKEK